MAEQVGDLLTESIADFSRRPSVEQYRILEEENRELRKLVRDYVPERFQPPD